MLSVEQTNSIEALIKETWPDETGPGVAVGIVHDGKFVQAFTRGVTNIEQPMPISKNTNFRIASVTKQFTAMALLILENEGTLSLNDSVTQYLPELSPWADEVTIEHLIHHTHGIKGYEGLMPDDTSVPIHDDGVVALLAEHPGLNFEPRDEFSYSNSGYACLAMIVERVSGQFYPDFMKERVFDPLGMKNTLIYRNGYNEVPNRAFGHRVLDGNLEMSDQSMTSSVFGDGGIYTSLIDYAKWDRALREGHDALPPLSRIQDAFKSSVLNDGTLTNYGYAFWIEKEPDQKIVWHTGGTRGFNHCVRRHLGDGYTIILFSNLNGEEPKEVCGRISDLLSAE